MLLQAFYSIRSERQLMERLEYDFLGQNLAIFSLGSNGRVRGRAAASDLI
jgi:transposase